MGFILTPQSAAIYAALALALVLFAVSKSRRQLCAQLVGGSGALIAVQVGSVHVWSAAVLLWLVFTRSSDSRQWPRVLSLAGAVVLLMTTVLHGDLVNSATLALQLAALAGGGALIALRAQPRDVDAMMRAALVVITIGSLIGLLQVVGVVPIDTWHSDISTIGRPLGIWPEPDWLGLMAAVGVLLSWHLEVSPKLRVAAFVINIAAVALSFARAAWVALALAIVATVIAQLFSRQRRTETRKGRRAAVVTLLVATLLGLAASPVLREDLARRVETLTSATASEDDISGRARILQTESLLQLAETAAPFGHGLSAAGRVGVSGALYLKAESGNDVASNWVLGLWVDGAYLAVPLILFLVLFALRGSAIPAGQMLLLVLINNLFSNALFQPVTWMLLGLTMLALAPKDPRRPKAAVESTAGRIKGWGPCTLLD